MVQRRGAIEDTETNVSCGVLRVRATHALLLDGVYGLRKVNALITAQCAHLTEACRISEHYGVSADV